MDPDRYCVDHAAPPGTSLYYATLYADPRARGAVIAVHALRHALIEIVETVADAEVRARKLNWWSGEILHARDGDPHHPVSVAVSRQCGKRIWRRPEVIAMLSAVTRVSAEGGLASEAARDAFCEQLGGGAARLCAAATTAGGEPCDLGPVGAALERALLAGAPSVRSGMRRIPAPAPAPPRGEEHDGPERTAGERARAHEVLGDAVRGASLRIGPTARVYRTLAHIQLAALASSLRRPAAQAPSIASISPLRKLWIAWRLRNTVTAPPDSEPNQFSN